MNNTALNKHQNNSAITREAIISSAEKLYAEKSIDAVSLSEVTAHAGQKNRNALQYHFGNREGLLQAILDRHAQQVFQRRREYLTQTTDNAIKHAVNALVQPLADYVKEHKEAQHYIMIVPQLAIVNVPSVHSTLSPGLKLMQDPLFTETLNCALQHLPTREATQRIFLATSFLFNGLADIYRACNSDPDFARSNSATQISVQLLQAIEAMFQAPSHQ